MNSSKNRIGNNVSAKLAPRMPFRLVLVVPFLFQIFPTVSYIQFGGIDGEFIGLEINEDRWENRQIVLKLLEAIAVWQESSKAG